MKCLNRTLKCLPIFFMLFSNTFAQKYVCILAFLCHLLQPIMLIYFQPDENIARGIEVFVKQIY